MLNYQRDFLLYRLLTGKLKHPAGLVIKPPTLNLLYDASEVYQKFYERSISEGLMTEQDCINLLVSESKWDEEKEKMLQDILPHNIEHFKEEIYRAYFQSDRKKTIRKYLVTARQELID
jgi:hypothetical protein